MSPQNQTPQLSPLDLEPTATDPIVNHYTPELAAALQKAASLGIPVKLPPPGLMLPKTGGQP